MRPLLSPEEMGAADRRTIVSGTPADILMERAGRAVARVTARALGGTYGRRVVIVCGPGNNGGDGLVAAGALRARGARVMVFRLDRDFDRAVCARALARADGLVDAMYGTGLRRALEGDGAWFAAATAEFAGFRIAVDIPSGVSGLTGGVEGVAVQADRTVCLAALKPGLLFEPGSAHAGVVEVVDIGIELGVASAGVTTAADVAVWVPTRGAGAHKWSAGGLLVVGGSRGMTGAPSMVSHAAMRAGAGIVWSGLPGADAAARASGSEVITWALPAASDGTLGADAAIDVLEGLDRFAALVLGPGLGGGAPTRSAVRRIVAEAVVPLVLDADGLNALEGDLSALRDRSALGVATVLTPHAGEFARLANRPVGADRIAAARRLAADAAAVVLLKGPGTVIAEPGGRVAVNPTGGAWLATAGSGDVLSGIVGAFAARGAAPFEAASAAAWVHGRAADFAGHTGLVAGDLITAIPITLRDLGDPREPHERSDREA